MLETTRLKSPRQLVDPPSSLRYRTPFQAETALPEVNSFRVGCQQFCSIPMVFFGDPLGVFEFVVLIVPTGFCRLRMPARAASEAFVGCAEAGQV